MKKDSKKIINSKKETSKNSKKEASTNSESLINSKNSKNSKKETSTNSKNLINSKNSEILINSKKSSKNSKDSKNSKKEVSKLYIKIDKWCNNMNIHNYKILENYEIDAWGYIDLKGKICNNLPEYIQFNHIYKNLPYYHADFDISNCELKTLKGCPHYIDGNFYIHNNKLTNLMYSPIQSHTFNCWNNKKDFSKNEITSLCDTVWINNVNTSLLSLPDIENYKKSKKSKKLKTLK